MSYSNRRRHDPTAGAEPGPGKYNDALTAAVESVGGRDMLDTSPHALYVLLVVGGPRGDGFEVQTTNPAMLTRMPEVLRGLAASIEMAQG